MSATKVIIVGLSGCSSTGKTTLAKLTAMLFSKATLIHEDDFYKHDDEIPINKKYGIQDWDTPEALDLELFKKELVTIKKTGVISTKLIHNNNVDDIGKFNLDDTFINKLKTKYDGISDSYKVILVDGFMLFNDPDVSSKFDIKLLIRAPYETLKRRRFARNGYQTLDSFWVDPPYYFDQFVYKAYKETHAPLFIDDCVEGRINKLTAVGIVDFNNDDDTKIEDALTWIADNITSTCN